MKVQDVIANYPEIIRTLPLNRIFYDYGQEAVLEAVTTSLKGNDDRVLSALEFLHDSFLNYQKKSWAEKIQSSEVLPLLRELIDGPHHLIRCRSAENLGWWNITWSDPGDDNIYDFFKEAFAHHFKQGQDPILLFQLFAELDRKDGGVWVNDYQVEMIWQLLDHPSKAMKIAGLACFRKLNPDPDEVEQELWDRVNELRSAFEYDFILVKLGFQKFLQEKNKTDYTPDDLEEYLSHDYQPPE